jgi:hypothetical protein
MPLGFLFSRSGRGANRLLKSHQTHWNNSDGKRACLGVVGSQNRCTAQRLTMLRSKIPWRSPSRQPLPNPDEPLLSSSLSCVFRNPLSPHNLPPGARRACNGTGPLGQLSLFPCRNHLYIVFHLLVASPVLQRVSRLSYVLSAVSPITI